jgi:hypothetical protein
MRMPMNDTTGPGLPSRLKEMARGMDAQSTPDVSEVSFGKRALNSLVKSLNGALPLFGMKPYPEFAANAMLPGDFVMKLNMVFKAGIDAGLITEMPDFEMLKSDRDLIGLAVEIDQLAENPAFEDFLGQAPTEDGELQDAPVGPGTNKPTGAMPVKGNKFATLMSGFGAK